MRTYPRTNRAAPDISTTLTVICTAISRSRSGRRAPVAGEPRRPPLSGSITSPPSDSRAGVRPDASVASKLTPPTNSQTLQSGSSGTSRGLSSSQRTRMGGATQAMNTLKQPASAASGSVSTSNIFMSRRLPAPSARRTAISWRRACARASSRVTTLAETSRTTMPSRPNSSDRTITVLPSDGRAAIEPSVTTTRLRRPGWRTSCCCRRTFSSAAASRRL